MDCPKCVGKLKQTAITDRTISESPDSKDKGKTVELEVDQCFVCKGVWFDRGEMKKYLSGKMTIVDSPALGGKLDQELDAKKGRCPRCNIQMQKMPAPKSRDMTIDVCGKCEGIWLDSTEIDRLEKAHYGKLGFFRQFFR